LSQESQEHQIGEARTLLESMALLEKVAAAREARAEKVISSLASRGMSASELAGELDISRESVEVLLERETPKPPHERAGISQESIERLDSLPGDMSDEP
jgi:predicted RNA-binding protein with PIN domain